MSPKRLSDVAKSTTKEHDTTVDFSVLSSLDSSCPIFGALNISENILLSDEVFYSKTLSLPAFPMTNPSYKYVPENISIDLLSFYHSKVVKTCKEAIEIERETLSQNTECWRKERKMRLTASNAHDICHSTDLPSLPAKLIEKMSKDLSMIPPIRFGIDKEPMVKNIMRTKFSNHIFRNTGFVIHPLYPF